MRRRQTLSEGWFVKQLDGGGTHVAQLAREAFAPKAGWLAILGVAAALGFLGLPQGWLQGGFMFGSFLNIIAVAPAIIYWVSLRPRLLPYSSRNRPRGPQGGW